MTIMLHSQSTLTVKMDGGPEARAMTNPPGTIVTPKSQHNRRFGTVLAVEGDRTQVEWFARNSYQKVEGNTPRGDWGWSPCDGRKTWVKTSTLTGVVR